LTSRANALTGMLAGSLCLALSATALAGPLGADRPHTAAAAPLKGVVQLNALGPKVHGYRTHLNTNVGYPAGSLSSDSLQVTLVKDAGAIEQSHAWVLSLTPRDVKLDRSKGTITVRHSLGARGAINFSFTPRRHRRMSTCPTKHRLIDGTLKGTITIKVGDRFFKTITIRRMTGTVLDNATGAGCPAPCPRRYDFVGGTPPYDVSRPNVSFGAAARASRRDPPHVYVSVFDPTAGSPFGSVSHVLYAKGPRRFFSSNAALTRATVRTPGGALSGTLSFASTGKLRKVGAVGCKGGPRRVASRPAKVTAGTITARFDSIGTYRVDTNLNGPYPHSSIPRTHLSREY
jgi:hypothetical protein